VVDGIARDHPLGLVEIVAARVQIAIEAGEVAAGDFESDSMARSKVVAGHLEVDPRSGL